MGQRKLLKIALLKDKTMNYINKDHVEKTFKGLNELKAQLAKDEALARKVN